MAKGLNKHTPNSDELLKRLNTNNSSGLDDFEKEALEGFDSLGDIELAKNLTDSLNKKLDETYFTKQGGTNKTWVVLSMAAGLVLVVGLSIFFMNVMGDKKEMAMENTVVSEEKVANEVAKPTDLSPAAEPTKTEGNGSSEANTPTTISQLTAGSAAGKKDLSNSDSRAKTESDNDNGVSSRMVLKETKPEQSADKLAENQGETEYKKQPEFKAISGPPSGNNTPASPSVVMDDQKIKDKEEASEKVNLSKNNSDANTQTTTGSVKKRETPRKQKNKNGEALGNEDAKSADESAAKQEWVAGVSTTEPKRDESDNVHNLEYSNHAYYKPQDYIKVEINKSEMLKTNVKAFKAELTINEKGTVTAVKFLTEFANCTGCKKELEKILLNMPGWKPKSKSAIETVSYIDQ